MAVSTAALTRTDLLSPDAFVAGVPHDLFRRLRAEAPVFWHAEANGPGYWAVTKYQDVFDVSLNPQVFSSGMRGSLMRDWNEDERPLIMTQMVNMDAPRHTHYRRLVNLGFTPRMIRRLEPHIRDMTTRIIDAVAARGECDFVTDIAAELPLQVILEMIGVPLEDRHLVFNWSNQMIGFDDPEYQTVPEIGKVAAAEMFMYAGKLAAERRKNPRDDLVTVLVEGEVEGEKLSEQDFNSFFLLLAVAGNETTRNLISGGMLALVEHPEQRARLLANPALIPSAVEEMLRWVSPVMHFRRTATRDTELRGQQIRAGDKVIIWFASANRDEDAFPHADRFDVGRDPNDHLGFGIGPHFCLGANLARLEIRIMFEELLRRLPDIELAGPVERLRSCFINGIKRMPVTFTPARG
jgi:cytochrome P450